MGLKMCRNHLGTATLNPHAQREREREKEKEKRQDKKREKESHPEWEKKGSRLGTLHPKP
jgi:hypothetical protein